MKDFIEEKRRELQDEIEILQMYTSVPHFIEQAVKEKVERERAKKKNWAQVSFFVKFMAKNGRAEFAYKI